MSIEGFLCDDEPTFNWSVRCCTNASIVLRKHTTEHKSCPVARLTRFEGRGHKKAPKGPPFAYVFWKNFKNKLSKGGVLAFSHLPLDFTWGPWPPAPPPLNAPLVMSVALHWCFWQGEWCPFQKSVPKTAESSNNFFLEANLSLIIAVFRGPRSLSYLCPRYSRFATCPLRHNLRVGYLEMW